MHGIAQDIVSKFKEKRANATLNELRVELHNGVRYYCIEARRSISNAHKHLFLKERDKFADWMDNAIFLLLEADKLRTEAKSEPWRR